MMALAFMAQYPCNIDRFKNTKVSSISNSVVVHYLKKLQISLKRRSTAASGGENLEKVSFLAPSFPCPSAVSFPPRLPSPLLRRPSFLPSAPYFSLLLSAFPRPAYDTLVRRLYFSR
eukprot:761061-Hanusia_phi.AAC.3